WQRRGTSRPRVTTTTPSKQVADFPLLERRHPCRDRSSSRRAILRNRVRSRQMLPSSLTSLPTRGELGRGRGRYTYHLRCGAVAWTVDRSHLNQPQRRHPTVG